MDVDSIQATSTAALAIISAVAAAAVLIITTLRQSEKRQGKQLVKIHDLVNSRYSTVLEELARVKELLASITNAPADKRDAAVARQAADTQERRVEEIKSQLDETEL